MLCLENAETRKQGLKYVVKILNGHGITVNITGFFGQLLKGEINDE